MSNILKQRLAAGQSVSTDHPSADVLSAFSERGLRESERQKVLGHLATCMECRHALALAAPETSIESRPSAARGVMHFPSAMRWASAAAALAVAVGVGVISMEHQSHPNTASTATPAAVSDSAQKPEIPALQNRVTAEGRLTAGVSAHPVAGEKKSTLASVDKKLAPLVASKTRARELDLNSRSSSLGALSREASGAVGGIVGQPEMPANAFANNASPAPPSQNGTVAENIAPPPPAVSESVAVAAAPAPSLQSADVNERVMAKAKNPPQSANQTVDVMAQAPAAPVEGFAPSYNKASGGPALVGAMRRSTAPMTELVSWTVTTAGKLQRKLRDGAVKLIEPAPGFLVRAVASHGIEVWAGGSQPDLSAKQWQQAPVLFHSSDAGETWTKVSGPWHGPINRLALVDSETLTVVTGDGTWTSRDAGSSWSTQ